MPLDVPTVRTPPAQGADKASLRASAFHRDLGLGLFINAPLAKQLSGTKAQVVLLRLSLPFFTVATCLLLDARQPRPAPCGLRGRCRWAPATRHPCSRPGWSRSPPPASSATSGWCARFVCRGDWARGVRGVQHKHQSGSCFISPTPQVGRYQGVVAALQLRPDVFLAPGAAASPPADLAERFKGASRVALAWAPEFGAGTGRE